MRLVDVTTGKIDKTVDRDFNGPQESLLLLMREAAGELVGKDILLPEEKALLEKGRKDIQKIETEYTQAQQQTRKLRAGKDLRGRGQAAAGRSIQGQALCPKTGGGTAGQAESLGERK